MAPNASYEPDASPWRGRAAKAPAEKAARALRMLLVEDDVISQQVILHLIQRLGHSVELATSGPAALAKLQEHTFDVVLMDVQLPGMNGLDVTEHLRVYERTHGGHLPVIAVTARAFPEDRARCLAVGMDAYITKPIQATLLYDALRKTVGEEAIASRPAAVLNVAMLLQSVGGDRRLLRELGRLFLTHVPKQFDMLVEALSQESPPTLERAVHALRGSMATFHAYTACHLLETLLVMGRAEQFQEEIVGPVVQALRREIEAALTFLRTPGWDVAAF